MSEFNKSGRGSTPLNVRRDVSIKERIQKFVDKLAAIDKEFAPQAPSKLLEGDELKKFKAKYNKWRTKLSQHGRNEKRYLAPEDSAETKGNPKMRLDTYRVRMSLYRREIRKADKVNPMFIIECDYFLRKNDSKILNEILSGYRDKGAENLLKQIKLGLKEKKAHLSDSQFNQLKKLLSSVNHPVFSYLKPTSRESQIVIDQQDESFNKGHTTNVKHIPINRYLIHMERILENVESSTYVELSFALALATGRRSVEILKLAKFSKPGESSLHFEGQAKGKLFEKDDYRIPVLASPEACIKALKRIRKLKDFTNTENDDVNSRTASTLNSYVKEIMNDYDLEFRMFRVAYGRLCVQRFYDSNRDGTEEAFLAAILGHDENDKQTVQHYKSVLFDKSDTLETAKQYWDEESKKEAGEADLEAEKCKRMLEHLKQFEGQYTRAKGRIYDFCVEELKKGNSNLNQSYLTREGGFSRPAIKAFLADMGSFGLSD
jgi:hypothetical protein